MSATDGFTVVTSLIWVQGMRIRVIEIHIILNVISTFIDFALILLSLVLSLRH